ncbi:oleoyl-acyl carrier protein thioesterase 1, chloroplastic-like [Mangifera indica]|uniref:oleoyl-acyl carrier protein thioesterase 1, chloroplastic-like n=1 Tax=Mangifera indica TaxID=29780 RepID=UPI001CF9B186|nr:oleoyl-acyl carrier protein thioesterase 1, chloroplastic-like [Mangifera indica]
MFTFPCNVIVTDQIQCTFVGLPRPIFSFRRRKDVVTCSLPVSKSPTSAKIQAVVSEQEGPALAETAGALADWQRLRSSTEDRLLYKEKFIVRSYEVGINKTATVETIANLLQEAACNHAQSLGFSTDGFATITSMRKFNLIWVLRRMHIEISKYPAWGDVVEFETWLHSEGRVGTRRDWIIKDYASGQVIGRATSKYVMMNKVTRRPQKASDEILEELLLLCTPKSRISFPDNASLRKISKLEDPAEYSRTGLMPRKNDLDMNQHVNSVTYIGWVLESMPQDIIDTHELQTITLDYRRECQHNDIVDSLTSPEPTEDSDGVPELQGTNGSPATGDKQDFRQFLHSLRLSGDGSEVSQARTKWRKKPPRQGNNGVL